VHSGDHRGSSAGPDPRRWKALALLAVADFVVVLVGGQVRGANIAMLLMTQSVGGAIGLAITAVGLPRRSESVPVPKISTTTSIAAAVPARSHHDH
jgi:hypothetical protein